MATHEYDNAAASQRFIGEFVDGATDGPFGETTTERTTVQDPASPGSRTGLEPPRA